MPAAAGSELDSWLRKGRATAAIVRPDRAVMQAGKQPAGDLRCRARVLCGSWRLGRKRKLTSMTELLVLNAGKHELQAVSLDGTRVRTLVAGLDELPDGIVVDQRRGHVYWTNMGAPDPGSENTGDEAFTRNGSLERADLDGANRVIDRAARGVHGRQTADCRLRSRAAVLVRPGRHAGAALQSRRQRSARTGGVGRRRGGGARCAQPPCRHRRRRGSAPAVLDTKGRSEWR